MDTYVETLDGMRRPVNRAYLVQVAVDQKDKPVRVPGLIVETESEKAEWEAGIRRRAMRKQRKEERVLTKVTQSISQPHEESSKFGKMLS